MDTSASSQRRNPWRAEQLAQRLDRPMGVLGLVFVFVVLGQALATEPRLVTAFTWLGWALWAVFAGEFALRAYVARDQKVFWLHNWWQLLFLVLPFLRFARALVLLHTARVGGVVSAAVRGSRSAGQLLSGRVTWLGAVTVIVVLASSQVLYLLGSYDSYGTALYQAALATIAGEPLTPDDAYARCVGVLLAAYSVVVVAALAAVLGAFFLEPERKAAPPRAG
ncbi:hypothetical protein ACOALZ_09735 [Nocardiopsis algeriensis]|uniref:hypothetical protein n=1 Tax=Nocardiopsis algeriensis TaxID=1478215 RepID=UPI003B434D48